jgi:hypothetical protein
MRGDKLFFDARGLVSVIGPENNGWLEVTGVDVVNPSR